MMYTSFFPLQESEIQPLIDAAREELERRKMPEKLANLQHAVKELNAAMRAASNKETMLLQQIESLTKEAADLRTMVSLLQENKQDLQKALAAQQQENRDLQAKLEQLQKGSHVALPITAEKPVQQPETKSETVIETLPEAPSMVTDDDDEEDDEEQAALPALTNQQYSKLMKELHNNTLANYTNVPNHYHLADAPTFESRLKNAQKKYVSLEDNETPLFLSDFTFSNNGKEGFLLTDRRLIFQFVGTKGYIELDRIERVYAKDSDKVIAVYRRYTDDLEGELNLYAFITKNNHEGFAAELDRIIKLIRAAHDEEM